MKKILVFNVNWVGDAIFSSPVFKVLKEAYPSAKVCCVAVPRVKEVLESIDGIDEIIVYDEKGKHRSLFLKIGFIFKLRREGFDAIFLLHRSLTRALIAFLAGIPVRVGYDDKGRGRLLTHIVKKPETNVHRSDYYLNVIESYGIVAKDRRCKLQVSVEEYKYIQAILEEKGISKDDFVVVVNAGGNWSLKIWPQENFSRLVKRLTSDFGAKVILTGAKKDISRAEEISEGSESETVILAGKTTLKQLMAVMDLADVVVSGDSGPVHLANSIGAKTISIFGPTRPEITGPKGLGQSVVLQEDVGCNRGACYQLDCKDNVCMQAITVERVCDAIRQIKNK